MKTLTTLTIASALLTAVSTLAAPPTAQNYRGVIQGVVAKFDRDWSSLNPEGIPDPGAIATIEDFLAGMNQAGVTGPNNYDFYMTSNGSNQPCNGISEGCSHLKVLVRNSIHAADSTLFGQSKAFDWDVVVWMDNGSGFFRFLEGYYTAVKGTPGIANLTLISCNGCSTVGHSTIEWDGSQDLHHIRATMYDARMQQNANPQPYGGMILDALYSVSSGDVKIAASAKNVCDSSAIGDSICAPGAGNDYTTGYSAILHGNTVTGDVYVSGLQGADSSATPASGADAMCIKADHSEDVAGTACATDGIDNFDGISAYAPANAPDTWLNSGSPWPMIEISDTPSF